jgi:hypothetical protein
MAIYTGNNGRVYIARRSSAGLIGSQTLNIIAGKAVTNGQTLTVLTSSGGGSGARFRAGNSVSAGAASRTCNFTLVTNGAGYVPGSRVYLAVSVNNTWVRMTANFTVDATTIRGVNNEQELVVDRFRIAKIRDWSYNSTSEVIETTALGDVTKTFAPSITSGEGNATLMFYEDDLNDSDSTRMKDIYELVDLLFPRDVAPRVIMSLAVDGGAFTVDDADLWKTNFMFNAFITSASVAVNYGEVVAVSTSFTVDGPLLDVPNKPGVTRL